MQIDCLTTLLGMEGIRVVGMEVVQRRGRSVARLTVERTTPGYVCGTCGQRAEEGKPARWRTVWHLMLWHHLTGLRMRQHRVKCPPCGWRLERLPFVERYHRVTTALAMLVPQLCKVMTIKAVALFQGLHRETVKTLDKRALQTMQARRPLEGITALGIDELAVGEGQTYWHLVSALKGPRGRKMLFVGKGRKERHLATFWRWWGPARATQMTHAVMDMWKPFRRSFQKRCPDVKIIYDKFHVIRHLFERVERGTQGRAQEGGRPFPGRPGREEVHPAGPPGPRAGESPRRLEPALKSQSALVQGPSPEGIL